MTYTSESFQIEQEPDFIGIHHDVVYESTGRSARNTLWVERANVGWVAECLRSCIDDIDFGSHGFDSGHDSFKVSPAGLTRRPEINLSNDRPRDAPHGGYCSFVPSPGIARQLVADLDRIVVAEPATPRRRWEHMPSAEESFSVDQEGDLVRVAVRQIGRNGRDMSGVFWFKRASVSWLVDTLRKRLEVAARTGNFPVAISEGKDEELWLSRFGEFVSLTSKRLLALPHGGNHRVWLTPPVMAKLLDELAALA